MFKVKNEKDALAVRKETLWNFILVFLKNYPFWKNNLVILSVFCKNGFKFLKIYLERYLKDRESFWDL